MPFSSSPVYVGNGDKVRVRYPTPSTWNTSVSVDVQIGTGFDEVGGDGDGITFSTKIPDGQIGGITFNDQNGHLGQYNASTNQTGTNYSVFQKNTTYYSNVVDITGIEIPVPATIRSIANGPKDNNTSLSAEFCIFRNGSAVSPGWRTSVSANLASPGSTGLQPGDKVQLRVTTPNWYITTIATTFSVGEETYDGGWPTAFQTAGLTNSSRVRDTWNITTRAQDQDIPFSELEFTDRVDQIIIPDGGSEYFYHRIDINDIDNDAVLQVSRTGDVRLKKVEGGGSTTPTSGYTSSTLTGVVLGDDVWVRMPNSSSYTDYNTGEVRVFAVGGEQYTRDGTLYENVSAGSYGSGSYQVTQTLGDQEDRWNSWTEVDRYPNDIQAAPIFTIGVKTDMTDPGAGFNYTDTFSTTTNGSGSGMEIRMGPGGAGTSFVNIGGGLNTIFVHDPGYGYSVGDTVTILSPTGSTNNASFTILEYEKVFVSNTTTAECEPGFMYFCDIPVSGLGEEYADNSYDNLGVPLTNYGRNTSDLNLTRQLVEQLDGQTVKIKAIIDGTLGEIRKNNTGSWSTSEVTVQNGDTINLKVNSSLTYGASGNTAVKSKVTLLGPPLGNPAIGNPTNGPSPTYPNETTTMTLNTRSRRVIPYPFHAKPQFLVDPGFECIAEVPIEGLDVFTFAQTSTAGADLSVDGSNWNDSITIEPTDNTLYIRCNAALGSGAIKQVVYTIGRDGQSVTDTFTIYNKQSNANGPFGNLFVNPQATGAATQISIPYYAIEDFTVTLIGAGGGRGGDDAPNSFGSGGGSGNLVRVRVQKPTSDFPLQQDGETPSGILNVQVGKAGQNGSNFASGSGSGGAGGTGYAAGGDGGNAGTGGGDKSGGGGGGGGASAIWMQSSAPNGPQLIALAGGGGGGAGAGNDTRPPVLGDGSFGNDTTYHGTIKTTTTNLNQVGDDGTNGGSGQGGGAGGGGGGFDGNGGGLVTNPDVYGNVDLDALGGGHGGAFYDQSNDVTLSISSFAGLGAAPGQDGVIYVEYPPQDTTPDPFDFDRQDGLDVGETVVSNRALISGITGSVNISLSNPGFNARARVCDTLSGNDCGDWGATTITNNKYLQLEATTGTQYSKEYTVKVDVGLGETEWIVATGAKPDRTPNFYNFATVDPCDRNAIVVSEVEQISGINVPVTVSIDEQNGEIGQFRIRDVGGNWSQWYDGDSGEEIENNQELQVRGRSSPDYEDTTTFSIEVGVGSTAATTWSIKTLVQTDTEPDSFTWIDKLNRELEEEIWSNANYIEGIATNVKFQVLPNPGDAPENSATALLPTIYVNGIAQLDSNGDPLSIVDIAPDDLVKLFYVTTDVIGEQRHFDTRVGSTVSLLDVSRSPLGLVIGEAEYPVYETDWRVGIAGSFVSNPTKFTFATKLASGPSVDTEADETANVSGLGSGISLPLITTNGLEVRKNGTGPWTPSTISTPISVQNGDYFNVRIQSSPVPAFSVTGQISLGNYTTSFTVQTPASVQDPILSQWYSSIQPVKYIVDSNGDPDFTQQARFDTKFDGLPIGSIIPVLQDGTQSDNWGDLEGDVTARFPGYILCDGSYVDPEKYPLLYAAIQNRYGEQAEGGTFSTTIYDFKGNPLVEEGDAKTSFRLPDFRNRYVKGTGVVDGNQLSSPGLVPSFQPTKLPGAPGNASPGATGGRWFVDTIGDPGVDELEQVETPAEGLLPTESAFFGIAQVQTTGYSDVSGLVEFQVTGDTICHVGLKKEKIYDTPLHFHELVTGEPDPVAVKGKVNWGQEGGYKTNIKVAETDPKTQEEGFSRPIDKQFNLWGYMYANPSPTIPTDYLPRSVYCPSNDPKWWSGDEEEHTEWNAPSGYLGISDIESVNDPKWIQTQLNSGADFNEINAYIGLNSSPWPGNEVSGGTAAGGVDPAYKWVSAIDIPVKITTIKGFTPIQKMAHNHYISLSQPTDNNGPMYSYGNSETAGNNSDGLAAASSVYKQNYVDLPFNSITDLGIQVLPGTFTLSQTKQLVPEPSLAPQDPVVMVSPYLWAKWLIKAY